MDWIISSSSSIICASWNFECASKKWRLFVISLRKFVIFPLKEALKIYCFFLKISLLISATSYFDFRPNQSRRPIKSSSLVSSLIGYFWVANEKASPLSEFIRMADKLLSFWNASFVIALVEPFGIGLTILSV